MGGVVNTVVGGIVGNKGDKASKNATAEANAGNARANAYGNQLVEFNQENWQAWKDLYGDLEKNIADYYTNIDGKLQTSKELQALRSEYAQSNNQLQAYMAQRGLTNSGLEVLSRTATEVGYANQAATIRANQDQKAAQEQLGFYSAVALPEKQNTLNALNNAYSNAGQLALGGGQLASNAYTNRGNAMLGAGLGMVSQGQQQIDNSVSELIGAYMMSQSDRKLKDNITLVGTIKDVNFYTWDWNEIACDLYCLHGKGFGVIADEVEHIPDAVHKDGQYSFVNYKVILDYITSVEP